MLIRDFQQLKLLDINRFIQSINPERLDYHMKHIKLARDYALLINRRLGNPVSSKKLSFIALMHDVMKDKSFNPKLADRKYNDMIIPSDIVKYVRLNLDILEEFNMEDYFNSDAQWHPIAGGIFIRKEFDITDPEIIYPIMFHSCPIIPIYETLDHRIRTASDIMMLADKLSSNFIKIDKEIPVSMDLDQIVFGNSGREFNYTLGLYLTRIINENKIEHDESKTTREYFLNRVLESNPWLNPKGIKIGGAKKWPKRKSLAFKTR